MLTVGYSRILSRLFVLDFIALGHNNIDLNSFEHNPEEVYWKAVEMAVEACPTKIHVLPLNYNYQATISLFL